MKKIKLYKYIICVAILILLLLCTFAGVKIINITQSKKIEKSNDKELFSYIVYDKKT